MAEIPDSGLLERLLASLEEDPLDLAARMEAAEIFVELGLVGEAVVQVAAVLQEDPDNGDALDTMRRYLSRPENGDGSSGALGDCEALPGLSAQVAEVIPPRFSSSMVEGEGRFAGSFDDRPGGLDDVGGMEEVKRVLELSFLGPMRQPELRRLYRKSLRGGLLLYGPPGCGKTFIARALAAELAASFASVSIADVLSMWSGEAEQNIHDIFDGARRSAPFVLFFDEIDALGHRRSQLGGSMLRTLSNQLLAELDGVDTDNEGLFVMAATNAPWDVDAALRRPGRLDRMVFVPPPDEAARAKILELNLEERPIEGIDVRSLVGRTRQFSGADLAHLCNSAAEIALADSIRSGNIRMINQNDMEQALLDVRPSTSSWLATARNVAMFANASGEYDDLAAYLNSGDR